MMRRSSLVFLALLLSAFAAPAPASAAFISLTTPVTGTHAPGELIELTVSFDNNQSIAQNLVGLELYIAFTGLSPVAGSYMLGDLLTPFAADLLTLDGACADTQACNAPDGDFASPTHYQSLVNAFAPATPTGPGTLFTLRFLTTGSGPWSLNVLGDSEFGLLWDPPPQACDPSDLACDPDPSFASFPFAIVNGNTAVAPGTARVGVNVSTPPPPTAVPEPTALVLFGTGLCACASALRGRALLSTVRRRKEGQERA